MSTLLQSFVHGLKRFDWVLMGGVVVMAAASLVMLASLGPDLFRRQFVWYVLFFVIVFLGSHIDWRWFIGGSWFRHSFYWLSVFLVFISNFQSSTVRGTKSWIFLGGFQFEPVEFLKVALILFLAGFFARRRAEAWFSKNILVSFFYAALPAALVILHPDLGSAMIVMSIWFGFLLMSGFNFKRVTVLLLVFALLAALGWFFVLRPYQKDRVTSFMFPERDPLGAGYNVIQSKIAIGSAGFLGKGFGLGTQSHLRFLPEAETDFAFAAFTEEWGIVGGVVLLLTFLLIVFRIVGIGLRATLNDYRFVSLGVALVLLVNFFANIGSNLGLTPVTGVPFPLLSYGGSSLLTTAILFSIVQCIRIES